MRALAQMVVSGLYLRWKIYWADRTFDRVRATNLDYEFTNNQFLIWSNDNRIIYHFDDTNDQIFAYNIITKSIQGDPR